jgi:Peptidase family M50
MTRSTIEKRLTLGRGFWLQWIFGNTFGYGVGLGLPIIIAELLSAQRYGLPASVLSFGLSVGFCQWLLLRQAIPISPKWILNTLGSFILCCLLLIISFQIFPPISLFFLLIYPLLSSLFQWSILRKMFRPSWAWVLHGFTATFLCEFTGLIAGFTHSHLAPHHQTGFPTLIGGLIGGFVYGLCTVPGLSRLMRKSYTPPAVKKYFGVDVPPNSNLWLVDFISALFLGLLIWGWVLFFQALSISPWMANDSRPLWLSNIYPFIFIVSLLVYIQISILIHELGHFILAAFNGFDLNCFAVGKWVIIKRGRRLQLCRTSSKIAGGFIQPSPKSLHALNKRVFMMILGGPVASLLLFIVGVVPLLFPGLANNHEIVRLIAFASILNFYLAVLNFLPLKLGYIKTDGGQMLDLTQNNPAGQRFAAIYGFEASIRQGIRLRDIDPLLIDRAISIPEKSMDHVSGLLMAYSVALDQRNFEQAGNYLDQALDMNLYYPELFRGALLLEGAYFEAHVRRRVDIARQWFDQIKEKSLVEPYSLLRAEAALLLAEGDTATAQIKAEQGIAIVQRDQFMIGSALAENEWLLALLQQILPSVVP